MITRIAISNFYCIRDRLEIDLSISGQVPELPDQFGQIDGESVRIPKVVGLFGPNASGKSTVLRVLSFFCYFIQHGFGLAPKEPIPCSRFASKAAMKEPVSLEIEFDAPVDLKDKSPGARRCRYFYSLVMDGGSAEVAEIVQERLQYSPPSATRRVRIFERQGDRLTSGSRSFWLEGYTRAVPRVMRANVSLISTLAQLGHEQSVALRELASRIETNIFRETYRLPTGYVTQTYMQNARLLAELNREISKLDLGISQIQIKKPRTEKAYPEPQFMHRGLEGFIGFEGESEGTRQFFNIFPMISQALHEGGVAVIDEFDSSIHPLILPELIRWFFNPKRNAKGAQLWFTGQNPYILADLPKESVLLCQKDDTGNSSAFRLTDIKAVRRNDNLVKKYLGGAYGAVPHIG